MAFNFNSVVLIGRVGEDMVLKKFPNGGTIANLKIVTNTYWKDKQTGEKRDEAVWHYVTIFNEYLIKELENLGIERGMDILIIGELAAETWLDNLGVKHTMNKVYVKGIGSTVRLLIRAPKQLKPAESPTTNMDDIPF